jgi:uncharacterized protein YjbI with pentapeptide repeats
LHAISSADLLDQLDAHRRWLESGRGDGRRFDLGGCDLTGAALQGMLLSRAKLNRAVLDRARLSAATLDRANLIGVHLRRLCWTGPTSRGRG